MRRIVRACRLSNDPISLMWVMSLVDLEVVLDSIYQGAVVSSERNSDNPSLVYLAAEIP